MMQFRLTIGHVIVLNIILHIVCHELPIYLQKHPSRRSSSKSIRFVAFIEFECAKLKFPKLGLPHR
jgi:hypothetical protein